MHVVGRLNEFGGLLLVEFLAVAPPSPSTIPCVCTHKRWDLRRYVMRVAVGLRKGRYTLKMVHVSTNGGSIHGPLLLLLLRDYPSVFVEF